MVVVKEGYSSQKAFITGYLDKKQQQLDNLNSTINDELPFSNNSNEFGHEGGSFHRLNKNNDDDNNNNEFGTMDWDKLPDVKPAKPPRYMKNFRKFIKQTQKHLDQVLANKTKIDFVHDIVAEIQKPLPTVVHMESDVEVSDDDDTSDDENTKTDNNEIDKSNETDGNRAGLSSVNNKNNDNNTTTTSSTITTKSTRNDRFITERRRYQIRRTSIITNNNHLNSTHNSNNNSSTNSNINNSQSQLMKQKIHNRYNAITDEQAAAIAADRKGILKAKQRFNAKTEIDRKMKILADGRREVSFNSRTSVYDRPPKTIPMNIHDIRPTPKPLTAAIVSNNNNSTTISPVTSLRDNSRTSTNNRTNSVSMSTLNSQRRSSIMSKEFQIKPREIHPRKDMPLKNFQRETFTSRTRSSPRNSEYSGMDSHIHLCPRNKAIDRSNQDVMHSSYSGRLSYDAPVSVINLKFTKV